MDARRGPRPGRLQLALARLRPARGAGAVGALTDLGGWPRCGWIGCGSPTCGRTTRPSWSSLPGLTALLGDNGEGKTNVLEAIAWLATLTSFRGAPTEALIRQGAERAVIRAEGEREGRAILIEAELVASGRNRVLVNRQPLKRAKELLGVLRVTVFAPDDLELVKGGPAERRRFLDDALVASHPRYDALRSEVDKVLKQRNALLKGAGGRLDESAGFTLDVWDAKLVESGGRLAEARQALLDRLAPVLSQTYDAVANRPAEVTATYVAEWAAEGLEAALVRSRRDDVRRGVSTVGPHRDDVDLRLAGLPSRTHASQGEQRSLALALRLAAHHVITDVTGSAPVLLLDDVFSELDPDRSDALLANLPPGQTLLTSASGLPPRPTPSSSCTSATATSPSADLELVSCEDADRLAAHRLDAVPCADDATLARWPSSDRPSPRPSPLPPVWGAATMAGMAARPLPGDGPGPQPIGPALDAVMRGLGAPEASGVHLVFDRWSEVVGEALAARTRPLRMDGHRLVLAVDEPAIATHVRFLQAELLARLEELLGPGRVTALDLRVGRKDQG